MFSLTSLLALVLAGVANVFLGFVWYSKPIFGARWAKEAGLTMDPNAPGMKNAMIRGVLLSFLATVVMAYVLGGVFVLMGIVTYGSALSVAFALWLGFMATQSLSPVLWEKKSVTYFLINAAYQLVSIIIIATILIALA